MTDVRTGTHDALVWVADKIAPEKGIVDETKDAIATASGKIADAIDKEMKK